MTERSHDVSIPGSRGQSVGALVGGSFGLLFVWLNSGGLGTTGAWTVRGLAAVAFLAVMWAAQRAYRDQRRADLLGVRTPGPDRPLRGAFWTVTAIEAVAILGGVWVISNVLHAPHAGVAWVALVVGAHFVPLAHIFEHRVFAVLGVVIAALGVAGLILAATGAAATPIALVSGVGSGIVLLAWALWGATRRRPAS